MHLPPTSAPLWDLPQATHPALDGDRDAEVVVVGAGIAGLTTAALLTSAGVEVVVLEARTVASGTSGHTTAKASALQGTRYQLLARLHGADAASRYARAQLDGLAWMAEQASTIPEAGWTLRPAVTYATTDAGRRSVEQEAAAATAAGLTVELGGADLPFPTTAALELADQGQLDPGPYLASLGERVASSPGGTVHEHTRVTAIRGHRSLRVVTDHGTVRAPHVVVATLLPITDRGFFFARAEPKSSYLVALAVDGDLPSGMYLSADEPTRSLRTARHGGRDLLLVGGGGHDTGRGTPTLARYEELVDWASDRFGVEEVVARWSAHDYVPSDHLPWVGAVSPLAPGLLTATGFEKWGMTMGTAAGLALADRITGNDGDSSAWAEIFDPGRTSPRGLASAARINAEVAGRLVTDWLRPGADAGPDGAGRRGRAGLVPTGDGGAGVQPVHVVCTHLGGVCAWNDGERTWDCPLHGSRFEPDGEVLSGPATHRLHRRTVQAAPGTDGVDPFPDGGADPAT